MGFIVKAVKSVVKAVVGVVSKVIGGIFGFLIKPKGAGKKAASVNTLTKSLDPEAFRKIAFGRIAAPLDQRYWEVWGTSGTKFDEDIAVCTHTINAFKELYFEDELAINAAGAIQGKYVGALTRTTRTGLPGQTAIALGGGQYDAAATFDGCAHMALHWIPDEKKLPNGIPSRCTQVIEAAMLYDPRRDSTVAGGSGSHRINDQTTWAYATLDANGVPIGRNNALQVLWYLIGWRIAKKNDAGALTGELELVAGRGIDPEDINLATFIAAANACEVAGYYTDLTLSTENAHTANEDKLTCGGLIGQLIDPGGLWCYYANVNDTANIAVTLTDADIVEGTPVSWDSSKGMSEQFTGVVGKFINPSASTLFQPFPYPMVRDAVYEANLGKKVRKTQDFDQILDNTLAQRLARLKLNEAQYQGEFAGGFNYRALLAQAWSVVRYISERHQFDLLFRVYRQDISTEKGIGMLLKQIDASIWSAGTVTAALAPSVGTKYNASQEIAATGVAVTLVPMVGANNDKADGFKIAWTAPPSNVRRTEVRYRLQGTVPWLTDGPVALDVTELVVGPLFSGAIYEAAVRHISIHEVPGAWIAPAAFQLGATGTVNYAAIAAAGGTATWAGVTGAGKPENNADVTLTHVASAVVGQDTIATQAGAGSKMLTISPGATSDITFDLTYATAVNSIVGNTVIMGNDAASGHNNMIVSHSSFLEGFVLEWEVPAFSVGSHWVGVVDASAIPGDRRNMLYSILLYNDGPHSINASETIAGVRSEFTLGTYAVGDKLRIVGDGSSVRYFKNTSTVSLRTIARVDAGIYFRAAIVNRFTPDGAKNIKFAAGNRTSWRSIEGILRPGDSATSGRNRIVNGNAESGDTAPWSLETDLHTLGGVGGGQTFTASIASPLFGSYSFLMTKTAVGSGVGVATPVINVIPGKPYRILFTLKGSSATAGGLYVRMYERATAPPSGRCVATDTNNSFLLNAPISNVTTAYEITYLPPAGTYFASLSIVDWIGGPTSMQFDLVDLWEDEVATGQIFIVSPPDQSINANVSGVPLAGQLPRVVPSPTVTKGGVSIKGDNGTTYALVDVSANIGTVTIDNTNGSATKGETTIPSAGFTGSGSYGIVVSVNGIPQPALYVTVTKQNAEASPPAGGKVGSTSIGDIITSTSFVQVGNIMTVTKGTGETMRGTFGGDYQVHATVTRTRSALMKWQYSPTGAGTWTDFGAAVTGESSTYFKHYDIENESPGSITCNQDAAPANGVYDVRLVAAMNTLVSTETIQFGYIDTPVANLNVGI